MNVQASSGNGSPRLLIIIISFIVKNASLLHEIKDVNYGGVSDKLNYKYKNLHKY